MSILYIDNANISFANDQVSLSFEDAKSVAIDLKVKFEGSYDRRSETVTYTRSANINEPVTVTFVFESPCGANDGSSVVDQLRLLYYFDMQNRQPRSKGLLTIVDLTSGETRAFSEAVLANSPEYDGRSIERGGTPSYTAEFLCASEVIN